MTRAANGKTYLQKKKQVGQVSDQLLAEVKSQVKIKTSITNSLKGKALTIPEISESTGLDLKTTTYYVMTLRRYGQISDGEAKGDYFTYMLKRD